MLSIRLLNKVDMLRAKFLTQIIVFKFLNYILVTFARPETIFIFCMLNVTACHKFIHLFAIVFFVTQNFIERLIFFGRNFIKQLI